MKSLEYGRGIVAVSIVSTLFSLIGCGTTAAPDSSGPPASATPRGVDSDRGVVPDRGVDSGEASLGSVVDRRGRDHDLDRELAAGKKVVLVFWQSWCAPCRREAPALQRIASEHGEDLSFYGIVTGDDDTVDESAVDRFLSDTGVDYPQIRDRDAAWWKRFGVRGTPTIIVLGPGARELYRGHRPPSWSAFLRKTALSSDGVSSEGGPSEEPTNVGRPGTTTVTVAPPERFVRQRKLGVMGTELEITAIGTDELTLDRAIDAAVAELRRVEDLMTTWRPSPLETLNDAAGTGPCVTSPEIVELVARAVEIGRLTEGAFDVTFGRVGKLWDFKASPPRIPTSEEIADALARVDYRRIVVDHERSTIELPTGTRIGLGGIAKGYGVDRAMRILRDHGVRHAVVNAGGDMKVLGKNLDESWTIAVKHPRDRDRALAVLRLSNTCLVTSGDYERFFVVDGIRYHHILDPRTGKPARGAISASVLAPDAAFADALATALCVLGPQRGLAIIERLPRVEALVVDLDGDVHFSTGLAGLREPKKQSS